MQDHEFDPITPEELAEREREAELARKIRREVVRIQRGEADDELREDAEREEAERREREEAEERERKRASSTFRQLISATIPLRKEASESYPSLLCIAGIFFWSFVVMFCSPPLARRYSRLEREVQMLRERSVRLQQQRYRVTTHSAVAEELRARGIELYDPVVPGEIIE